MFSPFAANAAAGGAPAPAAAPKENAPTSSDLDNLRAELSEMKRRLDGITEKT